MNNEATETEIEELVVTFICDELKIRRERIDTGMTLQKDFGLDGEDAREFLELFAKRFDVDMGAMNFDQHFGPEAGWNPFSALINLLRNLPPLKQIALSQLVSVAKAKRWQE